MHLLKKSVFNYCNYRHFITSRYRENLFKIKRKIYLNNENNPSGVILLKTNVIILDFDY